MTGAHLDISKMNCAKVLEERERNKALKLGLTVLKADHKAYASRNQRKSTNRTEKEMGELHGKLSNTTRKA